MNNRCGVPSADRDVRDRSDIAFVGQAEVVTRAQ
jgi:hypothetical protein